MVICDGNERIQFYETPGHNPGCLTIVIGDLLFTGDAYIPEINIVTNLPKGDKKLAEKSLERIKKLAKGKKSIQAIK